MGNALITRRGGGSSLKGLEVEAIANANIKNSDICAFELPASISKTLISKDSTEYSSPKNSYAIIQMKDDVLMSYSVSSDSCTVKSYLITKRMGEYIIGVEEKSSVTFNGAQGSSSTYFTAVKVSEEMLVMASGGNSGCGLYTVAIDYYDYAITVTQVDLPNNAHGLYTTVQPILEFDGVSTVGLCRNYGGGSKSKYGCINFFTIDFYHHTLTSSNYWTLANEYYPKSFKLYYDLGVGVATFLQNNSDSSYFSIVPIKLIDGVWTVGTMVTSTVTNYAFARMIDETHGILMCVDKSIRYFTIDSNNILTFDNEITETGITITNAYGRNFNDYSKVILGCTDSSSNSAGVVTFKAFDVSNWKAVLIDKISFDYPANKGGLSISNYTTGSYCENGDMWVYTYSAQPTIIRLGYYNHAKKTFKLMSPYSLSVSDGIRTRIQVLKNNIALVEDYSSYGAGYLVRIVDGYIFPAHITNKPPISHITQGFAKSSAYLYETCKAVFPLQKG